MQAETGDKLCPSILVGRNSDNNNNNNNNNNNIKTLIDGG